MDELIRALRNGSVLPIRALLALCAIICGLLIAFPHSQYSRFHGDGRYTWALVFALDGLFLFWRLVDTRPRVGMTRIVNALTVALWTGFIVSGFVDLDATRPGIACELGVWIASMWMALRTSFTETDRQSA
jgi:hypothetical protein